MSSLQASGWRALKPNLPPIREQEPADKQELFDAARIAVRVLRLPSHPRFILDQLVGCYRGELVEGRILVWPSNEFLMERTGISERSVRYSLAMLIGEGLIVAKDSGNGKRFAQRSASGQIMRAYGFDLSPLLIRLPELTDRLAAIKEQERERSVAWDELTIARRSTQEALRSICEVYPGIDITDITKRALELARNTPRRSATGSADEARKAWQALRVEAEGIYFAASAGKNCRHKDNNKYAPDQSCNNGMDDAGEETPKPAATVEDVVRACPDAMEFIGQVRSDREFVMAVSRARGMFGASASAWEEAVREIGPLGAAITLTYVVQLQQSPTPGSESIKNVGGYFRALVRLVKAGQFDLAKEIFKMIRRH